MRIVSWNVARLNTRLAEQAAALAGREPDVVALQEVTSRRSPCGKRRSRRSGYLTFALRSMRPTRLASQQPGAEQASCSAHALRWLMPRQRCQCRGRSRRSRPPRPRSPPVSLKSIAYMFPMRPTGGSRSGRWRQSGAGSPERPRLHGCSAETSTPRDESYRTVRSSRSHATPEADFAQSAGPNGTRLSWASFRACETWDTRMPFAPCTATRPRRRVGRGGALRVTAAVGAWITSLRRRSFARSQPCTTTNGANNA